VNVNPARAHAEIAGVERVSREALADIRDAVRGYRTHGLLAEIERARSVLEDAGVAVDCRASAVALTPAQNDVLALVLREAVTNVIRHAEAQHCRLLLEEQEGT
jgi:two-component system sensor histidine kinase DesK